MKKILFIDIDGTLINYDQKLPISAKIAIQKARENGHLVFVCTGRSKSEVYDYILEPGFDGIVGGNVAYIFLKDKLIQHIHLSKEEQKELLTG